MDGEKEVSAGADNAGQGAVDKNVPASPLEAWSAFDLSARRAVLDQQVGWLCAYFLKTDCL